MKKIIKRLSAVLLSLCLLFAVASCDAVKNGSKLRNMTITFSVDGKDVAVDFEIYENIAPATIEHVKYLIEKGYYNNSVVSGLDGHFDFGEYDGSRFNLTSKYDEGATNGYYNYINATYVSGKKIGAEGSNNSRYTSEKTIVGEFWNNGYELEKKKYVLGLDGALVLKREIADGESSKYDTGKGTLAVTFGSDGYYESAYDFAVFAKAKKDDADEDGKTSYDRLKAIYDDNLTDENENTYYYYAGNLDSMDDENVNKADRLADLEEVGRYFKVNGSNYDGLKDGEFKVDVDYSYAEFLSALKSDVISNSDKWVRLPSVEIKVKSVSVAKDLIKE